MVNRILIRIKVVQMLYSYLLTRNEFHLKAPSANTRDGKYAYSVYLNLLLLLLELSGYRVSRKSSSPLDSMGASNMLSGGKLAKALASDSDIREIIAKDETGIEAFDPIIRDLYSKITSSAVYTDYRKKRSRSLDDDVRMWTVILSTVIGRDNTLIDAARSQEGFSLSGFNKGVIMAIDTLKEYNDSQQSYADAQASLTASLEKAYELYHALLMLPVYITDIEADRLEAAKDKYCPSDDELNPNLRFVENGFVKAIRENADMQEYLKKHPFSWEEDYFMLKNLLEKVKESQTYRDYMDGDTTSFEADCDFWRNILRTVVFPSDILAEALENRSVYWNDDLAIMGTFVLKSIKHFATAGNEEVKLLPIFKDEEDSRFGPELFLNSIKERDTYRGYVERFINDSNWDPERLAFMDIVILITAISELLMFPSIPLAVTMNEYVEIANYYSTPRSGQFINGVLFSVSNYLREQGLLNK